MANINILVGSVYGNAQDVADMCSTQLVAAGHTVSVLRKASIDDVSATDTDVLLVCTSTTGQGDIPESLYGLYCELKDQSPPLSQKRYGLIGLGNSSYEDFAGAARQIDELFQSLQMQRIGEPLIIDACETMVPCEAAEPWVQDWLKQL